ncbi:MAG: hypothetical protein AAF492_04815 [Verrucomicrobiota bacterium]
MKNSGTGLLILLAAVFAIGGLVVSFRISQSKQNQVHFLELRALMQAVTIYRNNHLDAYPPSMKDLLEKTEITELAGQTEESLSYVYWPAAVTNELKEPLFISKTHILVRGQGVMGFKDYSVGLAPLNVITTWLERAGASVSFDK